MPYTRPYAGGFVDYPSTTTPIDATALNTMDVGIKTSNDQFQTVTTTQRTALSPTVGQAVWDSDLRQLMVFMNAAGGNAWQPVGNSIVCASTTRPSVPFEGQEIYETDTNQKLIYDGSSWIETGDLDNTNGVPSGLAPFFAAWTAYTPQIDQGVTTNIAKTVTYSRYLKVGRLAIVQARLDVTGTGTSGSSVTISLPSAFTFVASSGGFGFGKIFDSSTSTAYNVSWFPSGGVLLATGDWSGSVGWGGNPSLPLGASDQIHITFIGETTT
jgi:hypothetical protein